MFLLNVSLVRFAKLKYTRAVPGSPITAVHQAMRVGATDPSVQASPACQSPLFSVSMRIHIKHFPLYSPHQTRYSSLMAFF